VNWKPKLDDIHKSIHRRCETADGLWQISYNSLFAVPHFILKRKNLADDMWVFVKNSTSLKDMTEIVDSFYESKSHA